MILGTAGHIDHGKTTLVEAITGINPDRLKEEKERGITIELGFAHLDLDGERLGVVDVPGHERFVRHMVAGAGGIDLIMMIIAADEGVMPQTREHLEICQLMGVTQGFVVLTKTDLVEEEWVAMVEDDVRSELEGTFLEGCSKMLEVSAARCLAVLLSEYSLRNDGEFWPAFPRYVLSPGSAVLLSCLGGAPLIAIGGLVRIN